MKVHILKTDPEPFQALKYGKKTFEIRKDDRGFKVGDILELYEYKNEQLTDQKLTFNVSHILRGPKYGIEDGYCIMSIFPIV